MKKSKRVVAAAAVAVLIFSGAAMWAAQEGEAKAKKPAKSKEAARPAPDPSVPVPKPGDSADAFLKRHESFVKRAKEGDIGLLFLGDSITQGWGGSGREVWKKYYEPLKAANFGIGGDQTQHVLWRITNGELDGISPKVVVLMIGTNNTGGNTAESIAKADAKIVRTIREECPKSKVLLLAIFPRSSAASMEKIKKINAELAKLDDGKTVRYLDIGGKFLGPDGTIPKDIMPDGLHPNAKGYQIWADAMQPLLEEMMK